MDKVTAEFVIYMINEIASARNISPSLVYRVMTKYGCIQNYLVPYYDVLHQLSSEQVTNDVLKYVQVRGGCL